jgi:ureidoglycolate lyase
MRTVRLAVEPFSAEAFAAFGVPIGEPARAPDMAGETSRLWLVPFEGEGGVQLAFMRFPRKPMRFSKMERHFAVTQGYSPLGGDPFVTVVAPATDPDAPDALPAPETFRAFLLDGRQGLLMHKGVWHALDRFPVASPHVDVAFITSTATQAELMPGATAQPRLTQVVDYAERLGVEFEVALRA